MVIYDYMEIYEFVKRGPIAVNDPKRLFVKQFLAMLSSAQVKTIPINNSLFNSGIERMAQYFHEHEEQFGPYANKLELLFLKYSIKGEYSQFSQIIEKFNGRLVSLENPYYVKANIKLEQPYMEELLHNEELGIEQNVMAEVVNCFRQGAGLT